MQYDPRRLLSKSFDKLHEQLSLIRSHVEELNDPMARDLVGSMEFGLLAPMRKLRNHLDIPYDWHEKKSATPEVSP
ncbi:MAG TPA: hypothetical protein VK463_05840 [Desulfomonilaceae bacterium]|nr:hypothetical protein [Desulfomonilaceae bacterium]